MDTIANTSNDQQDERPKKKIRPNPFLSTPRSSSPPPRSPLSPVPGSQPVRASPWFSSTLSPGASGTTVATLDAHPTNSQRYQDITAGLNIELAKPNAANASMMKKLQHHPEVVGLQLVGEEIFTGCASKDQIFVRLAAAMNEVVDTCPIHHFLKSGKGDPNHVPHHCHEVAKPSGYFKCVLTKALNGDYYVTWIRCWTPLGTSQADFKHENKKCTDN